MVSILLVKELGKSLVPSGSDEVVHVTDNLQLLRQELSVADRVLAASGSQHLVHHRVWGCHLHSAHHLSSCHMDGVKGTKWRLRG